ncbi:MAG: CoA pyrophosphatase [Syntrophomonadaceae bacterium]|nr:CoA pyrophosphatase [Syntrophomonadaceae bacterium]
MDKKINSLKGRRADILSSSYTVKSAVLLPLVNIDSGSSVLFEKRSANIKRQPGEICFPGGKIDPTDKNPAQAAIRETCEELSLSPQDIELIAPLDIMVSPFNTIVFPFLGRILKPEKIVPNPQEVEKVFFVPLDFFIQNEPILKYLSLRVVSSPDYPFELIPNGKNYPFREAKHPGYFYTWNNETIWGMTARILYNFITLIQQE